MPWVAGVRYLELAIADRQFDYPQPVVRLLSPILLELFKELVANPHTWLS